MRRLHAMILIALLLCGSVVLTQAGIDKDGGNRPLLSIQTDSSSTFEIGQITGVYPMDTIAVPVYLHTSNAVTYIENRIYWNGGDLELVSVTLGPGAPYTASLNDSALNDTTVQYWISDGEPFSIPSGQPVAYLNFEVQCYGYYVITPINFVDDNNYNFYISGGQPYSPLRDNGYIRTDYEWYLYIIGDFVSTYSGKQNIPWEVDLYQQIPGKFLDATLLFDSSVLRFDSVTAAPGLLGGTVSGYSVDDTIFIELPESNPFLPPDEQFCMFVLHFGLLNDDDDFITYINFLGARRIDKCGNIAYPNYISGYITVPNHTASADIGNVWFYTTATQYDVTFIMDSNFPVNDYEFRVHFPADSIYFDSVVEVAGFTPPDAGVCTGDTFMIQINNGLNTNYEPWDLPATVFKLRFKPWSPPPAGTLFNLTFVETPENEVRYDMDDPFGYHTADLTLADGSILIKKKSGPGPGCPALYVWNGSSFEKENTILAACDGVRLENDVTDYYFISKAVAPHADELRFQIREDGRQISTLGDFQLIVVDHPARETIQVTKSGQIVTLGKPFGISWAKDHKGTDITDIIATADDVLYKSTENGWFDVSFGKLNPDQISSFTAALSASLPKDPPPQEKGWVTAAGSEPVMNGKKLSVSVKTADGSWALISVEDARLEASRQATLIDPSLIDPERELILRFSWDEYYETDVLDFHRAEPYEGRKSVLRASAAEHSEQGSVINRIGPNGSREPVILSPGETIDLAFSTGTLPPLSNKDKREYIFVTTGRYESEDTPTVRADFALDANYPNPFNPNTVIRYNLPRDAYVNLSVYDVRGALVRTLVSQFQNAGEKSVAWNGKMESGAQASSGVYFYQLKTPEFCKTRKMILLR